MAAQFHTFYTNARVLIPDMTFYGAKPQSVYPIAAKSSGIYHQITHANVH